MLVPVTLQYGATVTDNGHFHTYPKRTQNLPKRNQSLSLGAIRPDCSGATLGFPGIALGSLVLRFQESSDDSSHIFVCDVASTLCVG